MVVSVMQPKGCTYDNNVIVIPANQRRAVVDSLKNHWIHIDYLIVDMDESLLPTEGKYRKSWAFYKKWFEEHDSEKVGEEFVVDQLSYFESVSKEQKNNKLTKDEKSFIEKLSYGGQIESFHAIPVANACEAMYMSD